MIPLPFVLLLVALLLIYMEFFLPGGIMGTAGVVLILGALIMYGGEAPSLFHLLGFVLVAIVSTIFTVKYALKRVQKGAKDHAIYSDLDQEGFVASSFDQSLIGKQGEVLTDLKPSGHIKVEGQRVQAISKLGYVEKGASIEVIAGKGAYYIVKPLVVEE